MKIEWLHKSAKDKCIVFMNGWGCDANPFQFMQSDNYDVLMCYDYRDILLPKEIERLFENYQEVHLISWSLGVFVGNLVCSQWKNLFSSTLAINGGLQPIDNLKGIPPSIFQGTIDGLSEKSIEKFWFRMCGGKDNFSLFKNQMPERNITDQKEELIILQDVIQNHYTDWNIYQTVILGNKDLIFPFENLLNGWSEHKNLIKKDGMPHFCFYEWNSWDDLMRDNKSETSAN